MNRISTEAWVLHRGVGGTAPGQLVLEEYEFSDLEEDEVLARPIYGCWEGNMDHAIRRSPVDVCAIRGEERVVLGNAGVVQAVRVGPGVKTIREGDLALVFCNGVSDAHGYPMQILGYDAPGTMGVLAKAMKLRERQLVPVPAAEGARVDLRQWAAFSLRYITAWANWRVAHACWRSQMGACAAEETLVYGWGGGVSLAELTLARKVGCAATMIASTPGRLALLQSLGLDVIDRAALAGDNFEKDLGALIAARTRGQGVSIFVDNIGAFFKTTIRSLARQGVITTSGWKHGMTFSVVRAMECIARHIHVYTHYARYEEGLEAVRFAVEHDWLPPIPERVYAWEEVPMLADDFAHGRIDDYFPIFAINAPLVISPLGK